MLLKSMHFVFVLNDFTTFCLSRIDLFTKRKTLKLWLFRNILIKVMLCLLFEVRYLFLFLTSVFDQLSLNAKVLYLRMTLFFLKFSIPEVCETISSWLYWENLKKKISQE